MSIFVKSEDVTMFQHKAAKPTFESELFSAVTALKSLMSQSVDENFEDVYDYDLIEECKDHLQALIDYEPDNSPTSTQFERDGGFGLSDAERNR